MMHTLITVSTSLLDFLGEAGKVYDARILVGIDVQELDTRTKVVHQLAQGPRRYGPAVCGLGLVKLCMRRGLGFKGQRVRSRDAISTRHSGDQPALPAGTVINGDITAVDRRVSPTRGVPTLSGPEDGEE